MGDLDRKHDEQPHQGGNREFWKDDWVKHYDHRQAYLIKRKQQFLDDLVRVLSYFCIKKNIVGPTILDVGCGPGTLSALVLEKIPDSKVIGIDVSDQMVEVAKKKLAPICGKRFSGYVADFNSDRFWISPVDNAYHFIVSTLALHYLSDDRRHCFFKEVFDHLSSPGMFIAGIGSRSFIPEIAEMEYSFWLEFVYDNFDEAKKPKDFEIFKREFEKKLNEVNINWQSPEEYLNCLRNAGFAKTEIVWHRWAMSIYLAIK